MRIYIDFDDVLCETALAFTKIAKQMFGIDVPYREVQFFNLKKTFDLTDSQYEELMKAGHFPDNLLNYEDQNNAEDEIDMEELNKLKEQVAYLVGLVETLGLIWDMRFLLLLEDLLIHMNPQGSGLMNISLKECLYIVWINMGVKPVSRIMFII